ncbi:MAG: DEAD/DEAH box helicase [Janthinobacterium lividum]
MSDFASLGLAAPILKALVHEDYTVPTPIQAQAIPHVMAGRDVLGIAQTGTGKTAAFALPILHRLLANPRQPPRRGCRVLVLSPTRELASQIAESFRTYGRQTGLRTALMYGGVPKLRQVKAVGAGIDIVVATPGRLLDHMQDGSIQLNGVEVLVLDEADHMLDLGFIVPIRKIVQSIPPTRQTLFFSATMPREIATLAGQMLRDPVQVSVAPVSTTVERVEQRVIFVETARKRAMLANMLRNSKMSRVLVFTRTKHGADRVTQHLEAVGQTAAAIHGDKSQPQRERALAAFKSGRITVLVATDVAARGIDVEGVTHVVNFDLPNVPEAYVHRIGRTARAGQGGMAISFCDSSERPHLRGIEKLIRTRLQVEEPEGLAA